MSNKEIKEKEIEILEKPFRTILDKPKITITPSGSKIEDVWELKIDENGNEVFYVSGKTNIYEKTQAFLEETKIENILARCVDTGDFTALEKAKGSYMDITEMPKSLMEANNRIKEAENTFNQLPLEIRAKYDYNFNKYLQDVGSEEWCKTMGITKEVKEEVKEETEVKENANNE